MNVVSYLRVSGATQIEGDGFDRQSKSIEDFCRQHGLTQVNQYREGGVSGTTEGIDRPEFSLMLDYISMNQAVGTDCPKAIVVERMDRLARDLMVSELLLKECRERGIKVFSADQGALVDMAADGGDPTRVLIRQIMGALAQWEKSVLVKKLRAAKDRRKAAGEKNVEGRKPYGYFAGEAGILDLMMTWHQQGISFRGIARMLNESGQRTRTGKQFKEQNTRDLILNEKQRRSSKKQ